MVSCGLFVWSWGWSSTLLSGHLREGERIQAEALGIALIAGGLTPWAEMVIGACVINVAQEDERPFEALEKLELEGPIVVLFLVRAGAEGNGTSMRQIGWIGAG